MKSKLLLLAIIGFQSLSFSQQITNAENSSYQFEKIAHLEATPVLSQGFTGTCWSFSALSFFESELIRMGRKDVTLSEMYIVRKAYEEKADKYLRMDGKINFAEGGAFHDIPFIIKKYGIVPKESYKGLLDGATAYNHSEMSGILTGFMEALTKQMRTAGANGISPTWKKAFSGVLDAYIGEEPTEFTFDGKKYDPKSFAQSLKLDMNNYVSLTSFTNHGMNEKVMLAIPDNWSWGWSYNVALDDMVAACKSALMNGYSVAWGADVSEKGFSFKNGIALVPEDPSTILVSGKDNKNFSDAGAEKLSNAFLTPVAELNITPELRQKAYDNKTTTDDHGMHIVGLYKDQNGVNYFLVKNSWGTGNLPEGYLYVSENYFRYKTINIYLHKDAIPATIAKKLVN